MNIDRSNYEIWLIDLLDGRLSDNEIDLVNEFLRNNPDLKEEYDGLKLNAINPPDTSFRNKEDLKRSPADLSESQFNHLSVGYMENDLTEDGRRELNQLIDNDQERKKQFILIQQTKLLPPEIHFQHKSRLLKRTNGQKIIRLSFIGLSAAASVALLISLFTGSPSYIPDSVNSTAQNIIPEKSMAQPVPEKKPVNDIPVVEKKAETSHVNLLSETIKYPDYAIQTTLSESYLADSLLHYSNILPADINNIKLSNGVARDNIITDKTLIALSLQAEPEPFFEDDRSNLSKLLARTFREKILREETALDQPLKGYEIAEAGVSGLNKLLGWEMALDKTNDENGELSSIYFSSRVLKFNTPVKKSDPLP